MSSAKPQIKRTYGARSTRLPPPRDTSKSSTLTKRKRPLAELLHPNVETLPKKQQLIKPLPKKTNFTQLHFITESSILRTCPSCDLTYTRGAPDDEALHKAHCARVQRGFEWGKEDERDSAKANVFEVQNNVRLKTGESGRIVSLNVCCGGKLGQKVSAYLRTINTVLSAPAMTDEAAKVSKAYIFLLPSTNGTRETIVGCAIAQHITNAMAVAEPVSALPEGQAGAESPSPSHLVQVDGSMFCKPERLPTPVGIPRLFVSSVHRRKGIAQALLDAVCKNFIHGCQLDASKGELAFSQPTSLGRAVMENFGKGGIRVFEE